MPRLNADVDCLLRKLGRKKDWIEARQKYQDAGHAISIAQNMATEEICERFNIDLEKAMLPSGEPTKVPKSQKVKASVFADRNCSVSESILWVADSIVLSGLRPEDAPSATAWGLLLWVRRGPVQQMDFYSRMLSKLVPSRAALDESETAPFRDDGTREVELPEYLRAAHRERRQWEPGDSAASGASQFGD